MTNNWKNRKNIVYSTNADYEYETNTEKEPETLPPELQNLTVQLDKKNRKGKTVTLVKGFAGQTDDLKKLQKLLQSKCGTGGSIKQNEIIIQGDFRKKIHHYLAEMNYNVKIIGFH